MIDFSVLDIPNNNKISLECKIKTFETMQNELNLLIFGFLMLLTNQVAEFFDQQYHRRSRWIILSFGLELNI